VHRRQDTGADTQKNAENVRGGTRRAGARRYHCRFPRGAFAQRIPSCDRSRPAPRASALGAAAALLPTWSCRSCPVGLYYRAKQTFRSVALLHFGTPLSVERIALAPGAEPPAEPVHALTGAARGSAAHGDARGRRSRCPRADRARPTLFSAADDAPERPPSLAEEFEVRRRLFAGYDVARRHWPERAARLQARLERYEAALNAAGLDARHPRSAQLRMRRAATYALKSVLFLTLGLPAALFGGLVHYPALPCRWVGSRQE